MISTAKKKLQLAVILFFLAALGASFTVLVNAQGAAPSPVADWRPNHATRGWRYVGSKACAECHTSKFKTQTATHMGRALFVFGKGDGLRDNQPLAFRNGPYKYQVSRDGGQMVYVVSNGTNTLSLPISYVFGDADMGQTYVLHHKDKFYEGRVSYYPDIKGLDLTMGHAPRPPTTIVEAMGREMKADETRACFGCHSTNALDGANLQLDQLIEGITCEQCHGPGEKH